MFDKDTAKEIFPELYKGNISVFAGAGVGAEAGLPGWRAALYELSAFIRNYDRSISEIMAQRIRDGNFSQAAQFYYMANTTEENKIQGLEQVFGKKCEVTSNLKTLISLNIKHFITTNYDMTIEETWSSINASSIPSFSNTPDDFIGAHRYLSRNKEPFVIHIHGVITKATTLVLCKDHYDKIKNIEAYSQFLRHLIMTRSLLFVGFSFLDPAIKSFLDYANSVLKFICDNPSFAAIPETNKDLVPFLQASNVTPIVYKSTDNHAGLWALIKWLKDELKKTHTSHIPVSIYSDSEINKLKHNLAAVYTHFRIKAKYRSVQDAILGGVVHFLGQCISNDKEEMTIRAIENRVADFLHIGSDKATSIVSQAISFLVRDGRAIVEQDSLKFTEIDNSIDADLNFLVKSIRDRAQVRHASKLSLSDEIIREFLLLSLVVDGVRLAHTILTKDPIPGFSIHEVFDRSYDQLGLNIATKEVFLRSVASLFETPNKSEAKILGTISRIALLTDLVLHEPDLHSLNISGRPKNIYLDASIILPYICRYHPRYVLYVSLMRKAMAYGARLIVSNVFLEEVISHRRLAVETFRKEFKSKPVRFEEYVMYSGSNNINVFLGSFAGYYAKTNDFDFDAFLRSFAPYRSESELSDFLEKKGLVCEDLRETFSVESGRVARWRAALSDWYNNQRHGAKKSDPLILHEAIQLEALTDSNRLKRDSVFLTADKRFVQSAMEVCTTHSLEPQVAHYILMPIQLSYYLDLDEEREIDWRAYSQVLWSRAFRKRQESIEDFFIDRILKEYEPRLLKSLPKIINEIQNEIERAPILTHIDPTDDDKAIKDFKYLEQFDEKFYSIMNEEKKKYDLV